MGHSFATKAGGDPAVDPDDAGKVLRLRLRHEGKCLGHHEGADIQDVLANRDWQLVIRRG
jgi:hypothetical protein